MHSQIVGSCLQYFKSMVQKWLGRFLGCVSLREAKYVPNKWLVFADEDTEVTTKILVRKARVFRAVRNKTWTIEAP